MYYEYLQSKFGIDEEVINFVRSVEADLVGQFKAADDAANHNQMKVLHAMQSARLSDEHFGYTSGYGYGDGGREVTEAIFAHVFNAEAALVRPGLVSGTHAIAAALFGVLRPGDCLLCPFGTPYDTLLPVLGVRKAAGSLAEFGVSYKQVELREGKPDFDMIFEALQARPAMALLQRSKGYADRPAFLPCEINEVCNFIKKHSPQTVVLVDNCYGEFVCQDEPMADLCAGSLIKNPGGGIAPGGGYIVGRREYVDMSAARLTAPGVGGAVGPAFGMTRNILQGLFLAPQSVCGAVKGATLAGAVFAKAGFGTRIGPRADIIESIDLGCQKKLLSFVRGVQKAAPVDSFVTPEAAPMPGYGCDVVMAGGTFVQGASIELSADAPMREPYRVFFQGGLTYAHSAAGVIFALCEVWKC